MNLDVRRVTGPEGSYRGQLFYSSTMDYVGECARWMSKASIVFVVVDTVSNKSATYSLSNIQIDDPPSILADFPKSTTVDIHLALCREVRMAWRDSP